MKNIRISILTVKICAYLYLAIPIIIFYFGWLKIFFAVIFSALLLGSLYFVICKGISKSENEYVELSAGAIVVIIAALCFWSYMSGIGGFVWQREDWHARNAVLHDLIDNRWAVIFEDGAGLTYYVCFWMIPAIFGKLMGWCAANTALFIWTFLGLFIVTLLLINLYKESDGKIAFSKVVIVLLFFILWGGLNVVGQFLVFLKGKGTMSVEAIYGWSAYQYTPNNGLMEWVFNQALPAWIGAVLFLNDRGKDAVSRHGLLIMLLVPFTPYAAIGFVPILFVDIIKRKWEGAFSIANIMAACSVLPVFGAYFACNQALNENSSEFIVGVYRLENTGFLYNMFVLAVFLVVEVGVYIFLIWKTNSEDYIFRTVSVWLLIIPLIRFGTSDDRMFLLRGSIIPFFILMYYVIGTLYNTDFKKKKISFAALVLSVIIGFYSGAGDFVLTVIKTSDPDIVNIADRVGSMNNKNDEQWNLYMDDTSYVVSDADKTFFFGKLAR